MRRSNSGGKTYGDGCVILVSRVKRLWLHVQAPTLYSETKLPGTSTLVGLTGTGMPVIAGISET